MSDEVLEAIKSDSVEELEKIEKEWGSSFIYSCHYSIQWAMYFGSYEVATYLADLCKWIIW